MSQPSSSSSFQDLFNTALRDYGIQTGIKLVDHPLAEQLKECGSVDSITAVLQKQAQAFREFRGDDGKLMKSLKCSVEVLFTLSTSTVLGEGIGLVHPNHSLEFFIPDRYSTAIPTRESNICWHRHPPCRMSPSPIPSAYFRDI
jgi:hypothetical protein